MTVKRRVSRARRAPPPLSSRARANLATRCITALVGGYAAAAGTTALVARLLPIARVEATVWAMLLSFALYAGLGLWTFTQADARRAAVGIWGLAAVSTALVLLIGVRP